MLVRDRNEARGYFMQVWSKHRQGGAMDALEKAVEGIIVQHPEYHSLLESPDALEHEYSPERGESNPFLHLSMHVSVYEQLLTDRPAGVVGIYRRLLKTAGESHTVEHCMMECLSRVLWSAQSEGRLPNEQAYLECLECMP